VQRQLVLALLISADPWSSIALAQLNCAITQQAPKCPEHEIGMNLLSWINMDPEAAFEQDGDVRYANGLLYKLHCRHNVLRAGVDVFREDYTIGTPLGDGNAYPTMHVYRDGKTTDTRFRIGYERRFVLGRIQPFAGVDVGYRYFREVYDYESNGDFIYDPEWGSGEITSEHLFIAPLIGLCYRPAEHWSFTMETAFTCLFGSTTYERTSRSYIFPDEHTFTYRQKEGGMLIDPLRTVSVNYHF
jgi:hypothetical protein